MPAKNDTPRDKITTTLHPDTTRLMASMARTMHAASGKVTSPTVGNLIDYAYMYWAVQGGLVDDPDQLDRYLVKLAVAGLIELHDDTEVEAV
jgi:hypothetical protein